MSSRKMGATRNCCFTTCCHVGVWTCIAVWTAGFSLLTLAVFSPSGGGISTSGKMWRGIPPQGDPEGEIPPRDAAPEEKLSHQIDLKMMKIQWNTA